MTAKKFFRINKNGKKEYSSKRDEEKGFIGQDKSKTYDRQITPQIIEAVRLWKDEKIGIQEFMNRTKTNNSSCYSTIARTVRFINKHHHTVKL